MATMVCNSGSQQPRRPIRKYKSPRKKLSLTHNSRDRRIRKDDMTVIDFTNEMKKCVPTRDVNRATEILETAKMQLRLNVFIYTVYMNVLSKAEMAEEVFETMEKMIGEGIDPTHVTFGTAINACAITGDMDKALELHCRMKEFGQKPDVYTYNALLNVCAKTNNLDMAKKMKDEMLSLGVEGNVVTLNSLIKVYAKVASPDNCQTHFEACVELMETMRSGKGEVIPDARTFTALINLCSKGGMVGKALWVLEEMKNCFVDPSVVTYSALLDACAKAKDLETGKRIWSNLKQDGIKRDVILFCSMINIYAEVSNPENGKQHFESCRVLMAEMDSDGVQPNERIYNTLIKVCNRRGLIAEALKILETMKNNGCDPNAVTYNTLIDGFTNAKHLTAEEIQFRVNMLLQEMEDRGVNRDVSLFNSLINLCAFTGDLNAAEKYFEDMSNWGLEPNEKTYSALIKCRERLGDRVDRNAYLTACQDLVKEMEDNGMPPDRESYTSLLSACANVCDLDAALDIWNDVRHRGVQANVFLFGAVIKACLSVDDLDRAHQFLEDMEIEKIAPTPIVFCMFLDYYYSKDMRSEATIMFQKVKLLEFEKDKDIRRVKRKFSRSEK